MSQLRGGEPAGRAEADRHGRIRRRTPRPTRRCARLTAVSLRFADPDTALSFARAADVHGPRRRRLRPSGARAGNGRCPAASTTTRETSNDRTRHSRCRSSPSSTTPPIPARSAWVSANAGAGKTHVLAQRVIRLLLRRHQARRKSCASPSPRPRPPTWRTASSTRLAHWIALDDGALDMAIRATGASIATRDCGNGRASCSPRRWRRRAGSRCRPSTPSARGCCNSFRSRPMWRRISACWRKPQQQQMLEQIRRDVLLEAATAPESALGRALAAIIPLAAISRSRHALREAIRERGAIAAMDRRRRVASKRRWRSCRPALGIEPDDTLEAVEADISKGRICRRSNGHRRRRICAARLQATIRRQGAAPARGGGRHRQHAARDLSATFFCTGRNEPAQARSSPRRLAKKNPALAQRLSDEQLRLVALCEQRRADPGARPHRARC